MTYGMNNVNFTGGYNYSAKDIENLARYATGVAITNKDQISATEVLTYPVVPTAIAGISWLRANRKDFKGAMNTLKTESVVAHDIYKSGGSFAKGMKNVWNASSATSILGALPSADKLATMSSQTQGLYNSAKAAAELAKGGSKDAIAKASQLFTEANASAYAEKAASATGIWGKTQNALGITKLNNGINNLAVKSPAFAKGLNTFKAQGGYMMLALEGATEAVTNVIPTFKTLGAAKGFKQLGKSTVKTVASVGGWVAGAALGTKLGAAIGSIIPGAGTAVGAVVGAAIGSICSLICGSLGSRLAKKGAEKLVGKDELVLAQEKQAKKLAEQAQVDGNVLNQLVSGASERLTSEGVDTDDSKIAYNSLSQVASKPQAQPSFKGNPQLTTNPFRSQTAQQVYGMNPFEQATTEKDLMAMRYGLA